MTRALTVVRRWVPPVVDALERYLRALLLPVLALVLWLLFAPMLWEVLVVVASSPGGGATLFVTLGAVWLAVRAGRAMTTAPRYPLSSSRMVSAAPRSSSSPPEVLRRRAMHEAAHAVTSWAMGATVTAIDIQTVGDRGGQCSSSLDGIPDPTELSWAQLVICMSANQLDLEDGHHDGGSTADIMQALGVAASLISTGRTPAGVDVALTTDELLVAARTVATGILREHRSLVSRVADRLVADPNTVWRHPDLDALNRTLAA